MSKETVPNNSQNPIHNVFKDTVFKDTTTDAPSINRRDFIKNTGLGAAALGVTAGLAGCNTNDSDGSIGANLPVFAHGVASGDPLSDRVILWTRVNGKSSSQKIGVVYEVATDEAFTQLVTTGNAIASASADFTVKVDATGLAADTSYFYRFSAEGAVSPVGKTKTLPTGSVEQVRFAVFSCANYPAGYFNVYAEAAKRHDFDVAIHLGDYIYEYGRTDIQKNNAGVPQKDANGNLVIGTAYASKNAAKYGREVLPVNETISKADYRERYAQYRTDPDLQALHAAAPMIAVWDDHEIANDAYKDGAENHGEFGKNEGSYDERKMNAMMVYHEWMPTRTKAVNQIYRSFDFGDLVSLHMLDTRIYGRDKQLSYTDYMTATGMDSTKFATDMVNPKRHMLGEMQQFWTQMQLQKSAATWQILGQQVLMGRMNIPAPILLETLQAGSGVSVTQYAQIAGKAQAAPQSLTPQEKAILAQPSIPYNLDAWDGYAVAREVVLGTAKALDKNLVVLSGDTHNAWANDLKDKDNNQIGVEFATASVSSPGFEEYIPTDNPAQFAGLITQLIPDLKYFNSHQRGYMNVTVTKTACTADWIFVDKIDTKQYTASVGKTMQVNAGKGNRKLV